MNIFSLLIFLFIILSVLKLAGIITVGWLAVFTPLFIWVGLLLLIFGLGAIAVGAARKRY
jgi:Transmembrane Fragile-X-F protein.